MEKVRKLAKEIRELLKKIEFETGVETEFVPEPVVRFYAKVRLFKALTRCEKERNGGDREQGNKRRRNHDEGSRQRESP